MAKKTNWNEIFTEDEKKVFRKLWDTADNISHGKGSTKKQREELADDLHKVHDDILKLFQDKYFNPPKTTEERYAVVKFNTKYHEKIFSITKTFYDREIAEEFRLKGNKFSGVIDLKGDKQKCICNECREEDDG